MSEQATFLKIGTASIVLRMLERPGTLLRDMTLENPIRAIREISHDPSCTRRVRLASGRELSALEIQQAYAERAERFAELHDLPPEEQRALELWQDTLSKLESDPSTLTGRVDWVTKLELVEAYCARHQISLSHPRVAMIDLAYHDVDRSRGLYYVLQAAGRTERVTTDEAIDRATEEPPQTTRARLRGEFIREAKAHRRDFTVDWVHLKLNDQAQRTVLCKDPFKAHDERVERLIASL
jgi:proteasome accessory factor A